MEQDQKKGKTQILLSAVESGNSPLLETFAKYGEEIRKEFDNQLQSVDENKP